MKLVPVWSSQKQGRGEIIAYMKCDDRDFPILSAIKWKGSMPGKSRTMYASFSVSSETRLWAHILVASLRIGPASPGMVTDHIDGDGLNNQTSNLRIVTHRANIWNQRTRSDNTTGYRGVSRCGKRFVAKIGNRVIGRFGTAEEAAAAYGVEARAQPV